jgi:hypothetical protein
MNLDNLARRALERTKQASEDAVPTAFGNHGRGLVDPNPAGASASHMGSMRINANEQNYLDGQVLGTGTNLIPYKGLISERYQTISNAINNVPMMAQPGMDAKTASEERQDFINDMSSRQVEIDGYVYPLFENFVPDSPEMFLQLSNNALEKTASEATAVIYQFINEGKIPQELIPYLV